MPHAKHPRAAAAPPRPLRSPTQEHRHVAARRRAHPYAVVTGASSGIGLELARLCAQQGFDLLVIADDAAIEDAAASLCASGIDLRAVQAHPATVEGVDRLLDAASDRPVDYLPASAGHGLGRAFLDQEWPAAAPRHRHQRHRHRLPVAPRRPRGRERGHGHLLVTGSIAGPMPVTFQAVYNVTRAFVDPFAAALRHALEGSGIGVTCLLPGVPDARFFERADLLGPRLGAQDDKADPADVAETGFEAMMQGEGDVVAGWKNKAQVALTGVVPTDLLAERHRSMAGARLGRAGALKPPAPPARPTRFPYRTVSRSIPMALSHSDPGTPIDARPLGVRLADTPSHALLKTGSLELMRVVLRAGEALPPHAVDAEATLHCIEGSVRVQVGDRECRLDSGTLILVPAGHAYAVCANEDASLLVTMLLPYGGSASATSPG